MSSDQENLKRQSAAKALDIILPKLYEDSIIGIGTGSTVDLFIEMLAEKNPVFKAAVSSSGGAQLRAGCAGDSQRV